MTDDATRQFVAMMPFAELLGIELEHASAELRDDSGRLVAQVTQAQAVLAAGSPSA